MPPHLHPRSRFTSSLFATTLFASFFVVALPHVLPCPAPRIAYADGEMPDGSRRRRRRQKCQNTEEGTMKTLRDGTTIVETNDNGDNTVEPQNQERRLWRECPVPKPSRLVGEILGFKSSSSGGDEKGSRPP